jgi:hypothetical protein
MATGQLTAQANNVVQPLIQQCICPAGQFDLAGKNAQMKGNLTELATALQTIATALGTQASGL